MLITLVPRQPLLFREISDSLSDSVAGSGFRSSVAPSGGAGGCAEASEQCSRATAVCKTSSTSSSSSSLILSVRKPSKPSPEPPSTLILQQQRHTLCKWQKIMGHYKVQHFKRTGSNVYHPVRLTQKKGQHDTRVVFPEGLYIVPKSKFMG